MTCSDLMDEVEPRVQMMIERQSFLRKGVAVAVLSGICYGLYAAFLTLGLS